MGEEEKGWRIDRGKVGRERREGGGKKRSGRNSGTGRCRWTAIIGCQASISCLLIGGGWGGGVRDLINALCALTLSFPLAFVSFLSFGLKGIRGNAGRDGK